MPAAAASGVDGVLAADADPDPADECLRHSMEYSQHALDKCTLYGANLELVREALADGEKFLDLKWGGIPARVFEFLPERWLFLNR